MIARSVGRVVGLFVFVWAYLKRALLPLLALTAYGVGVVLRVDYVLDLHHPRNSVVSDVMRISALAQVLADPAGRQECFHTIWPPGASAYLALHIPFDPTLGSAAVGQVLMSCASPLLIAHAARMAYGARAGWIALLVSALHFGFIHYAGYFLSEAPFQLAISIAVWATVAALVMARSPTASQEATQNRLWPPGWPHVAGLVSGVAWGLAYSIRPNALPIALFAGAWMGVRWLRRRDRRALAGLIAGALGLLLVAAPLALRCTRLLGHFCPGAANFAMNVALGHTPDTTAIHFIPGPGQCSTGQNSWAPPALGLHGYQGTSEIHAAPYETWPILSWVIHELARDPLHFFVFSIGNAADLLQLPYWPSNFAKVTPRQVTVMSQIFLVGVLVPALGRSGAVIRDFVRGREVGDEDFVLVAIVVALFLLSAASLGEPRYRLPLDGVFIMLGARALGGKLRTPVPKRSSRAAIATVGGAVFAATGLLVAAADPSVRLAARIASMVPPPTRSHGRVIPYRLSELATVPAKGSAWNAAGNVVLRCTPGCEAISVDLGTVRHSPIVEVSTDASDRYEAIFYLRDAEVGRVGWGAFEESGMRTTRSVVPLSAIGSGYDSMTIRPLYGDGSYSVGHIAFVDEP